MEPKDDTAKPQDVQARKKSGLLVAAIMFIAAYGIFVFR